MRKMLLTPLLMCMVALLSMLVMPAVSVKPKTFKSEHFIELNWDWVGFGGTSPYTWIGTVWGDINGDFYISLVGASFPGQTEHFSETWLIVTDTGVIEGWDEGVWSFNNFRWSANGKVTGATGGWSDLVDYDMHYDGTTTEFPVPYGTPVNGTGKLILSEK